MILRVRVLVTLNGRCVEAGMNRVLPHRISLGRGLSSPVLGNGRGLVRVVRARRVVNGVRQGERPLPLRRRRVVSVRRLRCRRAMRVLRGRRLPEILLGSGRVHRDRRGRSPSRRGCLVRCRLPCALLIGPPAAGTLLDRYTPEWTGVHRRLVNRYAAQRSGLVAGQGGEWSCVRRCRIDRNSAQRFRLCCGLVGRYSPQRARTGRGLVGRYSTEWPRAGRGLLAEESAERIRDVGLLARNSRNRPGLCRILVDRKVPDVVGIRGLVDRNPALRTRMRRSPVGGRLRDRAATVRGLVRGGGVRRGLPDRRSARGCLLDRARAVGGILDRILVQRSVIGGKPAHRALWNRAPGCGTSAHRHLARWVRSLVCPRVNERVNARLRPGMRPRGHIRSVHRPTFIRSYLQVCPAVVSTPAGYCQLCCGPRTRGAVSRRKMEY